jgi:hypothetical protein
MKPFNLFTMKAQKQFSLKPVLIIILMTPASASNLDDADTDAHLNGLSPLDNNNIVTIIVFDGIMKITYYWDTSLIDTINFDGFNFIFSANNFLTATDGTNTYNGTWSITESNSYDIDDLSEEKINLCLTSSVNFVETIDDWMAIDTSPPCIRLNDIIDDNGEVNILTCNAN